VAQVEVDVARLRAQTAPVVIVASAGGFVRWNRKAVGERLTAGETLGIVTSPENRYVEVRLKDRDDRGFQPGDVFLLTFPNGRQRHGRVSEVQQTAPGTEGLRTRIVIEPLDATWPDVVDSCRVDVEPLRK
jgi:multidrug resistance efflux pump